MEILSINAESKLANVAAAIGRNPRSWEGWSCLMIDVSTLELEMHQECLIWVKSILESYLKDIEGRVYYCNESAVHIIAKGVEKKILYQAGQQICDMIESESKVKVLYDLFDLGADGIFYAQHVLEKMQTNNSISVSTAAGLDDLISKTLGNKIQSQTLPLTGGTIPTSERKVLLVEDDPVTRWMVRSALKGHCCFASAPSASKAFAMFDTYKPDIVFLDIGLPDKSGRIVLEWIMRHNPSACVVMFSGNDHLDNIAGALEDGATGFIAKPFLKEQLLHYLQNYQTN